MNKKYIAGIVAIVIIAGIVGGYAYYNNMQATKNTGTMNVGVADAPLLNTSVTGVFMTFDKVSLHSNTTGWSNYSVTPQTVNIMNVSASNPFTLSNLTLSSGRYTTIRLYITNVSAVILGVNVSFTLKAPFAFVTHTFTVAAHSTLNVVMDFHLNSDLNTNAQIFTPNVGVVVTGS
jgi:hypothetical protein